MNFKKDLAEILKKDMASKGISFDAGWDDYTVCLNYVELTKRWFNSSVPYKVVYSKELLAKLPSLTQQEQDAIKDIEKSLTECKSITAYMSKLITSTEMKKSDFFLKNWDIYHLHLEKLSAVKRNYTMPNLLFFQPKGNIIHFIDVRKHPKGAEWFVRDLLEIIHNNWPWLLRYINGVKSVGNISNEDMYSLSKHAVAAINFHGKVLMPTNVGVATSGHSSLSVRKADDIFNNLKAYEDWLKSNEKEIRESIYSQTKRKTTNKLDYELLIENDWFIAYEKNTQAKIELFKCTL